jgi:UDP-N-acetylmuramoyl-L-alanyl-D-glutamate--2,6-diaminopimelate ligase
MQRYGASKAALFGWPELKHAVINLDDSFGRQLAQAVMKNSDTDVLGYGLQAGNPSDPVRCLRASAIRLNPGGMEFMVHSPWGQAPVKSQLLGRFNVHNLLGVLGALLLSGVKLDEAVRAVGQVQPVAGRMQRVTVQDGPAVVVDYAHTPDALEKVLMGLKETIAQDPTLSPKKPVLYCVFGCGGERDRGKRPLMGEIACHQADEVWITSDNPRGEDPQVIIEEILKGAKSKNAGCSIQIEPDRARAIHAAIAKAQPWDVVLIAGKGHESHQEVAGNKVPFDDVKVALVALKSWRPSGRGH